MRVVLKLELADDFDSNLTKKLDNIVAVAVRVEKGSLNEADYIAAIQAHITETRRLVHQAYRLGLKQTKE